MKIILVNLKHGSNLGDRLIAECLEAGLAAVAPDIAVETTDLAGRDRPSGSSAKRRIAFLVLDRLPAFLRSKVSETMLRRLATRVLQPKWSALMAGADAVVIGGGGIFADSDLNFPIKIGTALDEATRAGVPVAIQSVGVARHWTRRGTEIFGTALAAARLIRITARDAGSQAHWAALLADYAVGPAELAPDPALLTRDYFPRAPKPAGAPVVGLCVTSPEALQYHGKAAVSAADIARWYQQVATELVARGYAVEIFTTGVPEDRSYVDRLFAAPAKGTRVRPDFASAAEMVAMIGGCDLIVAHRLHAIIPAFSYGIPALALAWDEKMEGQAAQMGYPERLVDVAQTSPAALAERAAAVLAEGLAEAPRERLIASAAQALQDLVAAVRHA